MMSEEVTYATLMFQDSVGERNNRDRNYLRNRGRSSETARCDLGGMKGGKVSVPMLESDMLWNLQNRAELWNI